jgi:hypothetical protein
MYGNPACSLGGCSAPPETLPDRFLIPVPLYLKMAQIIITAGNFIFLLQLKQDQVQQFMNDGRGLDGQLSSPFDLVDERSLIILADAQDGSGEPRPVSLEVFHLLAVFLTRGI